MVKLEFEPLDYQASYAASSPWKGIDSVSFNFQFPRQDASQQGSYFYVRVHINLSASRNQCSIVAEDEGCCFGI